MVGTLKCKTARGNGRTRWCRLQAVQRWVVPQQAEGQVPVGSTTPAEAMLNHSLTARSSPAASR